MLALELVVDLEGRLGQQEQAADDQNQVAAGDVLAGDVEQRRREARHPGDRKQQGDAHPHRRQQADAPRAFPLLLLQFGGEDRDEDDIVHAKDDLEDSQRNEGDNKFGHG